MHVMTSKSRVCIIPGDGAAPEAMLASLRVLDALALPIECDAVPPGSELLDLSIAEREALIRERVDNSDTALFGSSDGTTPGAQYCLSSLPLSNHENFVKVFPLRLRT